MAAKKRPGRKVLKEAPGSALNYTGTMSGVGKTIGVMPGAKDRIKMPAGPAKADVNEPQLSGGKINHGKVPVKPKAKPKHVKVKRY